ncbi:MAG: hypothetical protein ABSH52_35470 [Terriglobia bacterium]
MLIADIHGHSLAEAQNNEDYLTSAVFGHLRYIPPEYFWERLLSRARGLPDRQDLKSLDEFIRTSGHRLSEYLSLQVLFWPAHRRRGEPDLILSFTGIGLRPITIVVEVKLWSGKSGGDEDQLVRYLQILDELKDFCESKLPEGSLGALVYLTPRESTEEIVESLKSSRNPDIDGRRVFRLQWQDFIGACDETLPTGDSHTDMILQDVRSFLKARGLEYFTGFRRIATLPDLRVKKACFSKLFVKQRQEPAELEVRRAPFNRLLVRRELPENFACRGAPWIKRTQRTANRSAPR